MTETNLPSRKHLAGLDWRIANVSCSKTRRMEEIVRVVAPDLKGFIPDSIAIVFRLSTTLLCGIDERCELKRTEVKGGMKEMRQWARGCMAQFDYLTGDSYRRLHNLIYLYSEDER